MIVSDVSKPTEPDEPGRNGAEAMGSITVTTEADKGKHHEAVNDAKQRIQAAGHTPRIVESFATPSRESFVTVIAPAE